MPEIRTETMTVNMGPQHPSTHGVLRLVLELDGETVRSASPTIGYLHTGIEKTAEQKKWQQVIPLVERMDYLGAQSNSLAYVLSVEKLLGLEMPFIIDHMGRVVAKNGLEQKPFKLMLDLMKEDRVWTKVSGFERVSSTGKPFHDAMPYARALVEAAPDRVLWGTDYPHPNVKEMPNDGEQVDLFAETITDEAMRKRILVDNPARLYVF